MEESIANVRSAIHVLNERVRGWLTWMTTVGLSIVGFYLTFLFQVRDLEWVQSSWLARAALVLLLGSVFIGSVVRALIEVGETGKHLGETSTRLVHLMKDGEQATKQLADEVERSQTTQHARLLMETEQELARSLSLVYERLSEVRTVFSEAAQFSAKYLAIPNFLKFLVVQFVLLATGSGVAICVVWTVVF